MSVETISEVTQLLAIQALGIIEDRYGPDSPDHLGYHDTEHTRQVIAATMLLGNLALTRGNITQHESQLLIIAGAFHDVEQGLGSGRNETESASQAENAMRKTGLFTSDDIEKVRTGIMATQVVYDAGHLEQSATDYFTKLLADADLVSLGSSTEQYWDRTVGLFYEWYGERADDREARIQFMTHQITLLSTHVYYTVEARTIFTNQPFNKKYSKAILDSLLSS